MRKCLVTAAAAITAGLLMTAGCGSDEKHDTAEDRQEITAAFVSFFNGANADHDKKAAELQDGARLKQALVDNATKGPLVEVAKRSTTKVTNVTFLDKAKCEEATSPDVTEVCAEVTHDLLLEGNPEPAIAGQKSYAVFADDTWKVSKVTFCGLLAQSALAGGSGQAPPACNEKSE